MDSIIAIFSHNQILDAYLLEGSRLQVIRKPLLFLNEIEKSPKYFQRMFTSNKKQDTGLLLRKLTLIHITLLYSDKQYHNLSCLSLNFAAKDEWVTTQIITPYSNFLQQLYEKIRTINLAYNHEITLQNNYDCKTAMRESPSEYFNCEFLCYCINLLLDLFQSLKKISALGRYFHQNAKNSIGNFVETASLQVVQIYFAFKFVLNQIITNHSNYLPDHQSEVVFKDIVSGNLEEINQNLKTLLLNKYFCPIEKGIKTTLFELEKQQLPNLCFICNLFDIELERNKKGNRKALEVAIFGNKQFNSDLFEKALEMINCSEGQETINSIMVDKQNSILFNNKAVSLKQYQNTKMSKKRQSNEIKSLESTETLQSSSQIN